MGPGYVPTCVERHVVVKARRSRGGVIQGQICLGEASKNDLKTSGPIRLYKDTCYLLAYNNYGIPSWKILDYRSSLLDSIMEDT